MNPAFFIRLFALAKKEALHMLRDFQVVYLALGMPVVLVLLFGYAVSFDVEDVKVAVVDHDQTPDSRRFLQRLDASDAFQIVERLEDANDIEPLFRRGLLKAAFVVPKGHSRALARNEESKIQLLVDGADGTTARIVIASAAAMGLAETLDLVGAHVASEPAIDPSIRTWFNPELESALFVVPGLVAVVLAILAVLLSGLTVAREWERGSMEQLFATPVDRLSIVLGKVAPYVLLGLLQFLMVMVAGAYLFDVPVRGSFPTLFLAVFLFLICALGQGLFISTVTKSQQLAVQFGAISSILPSLLLSGFLFPVANMPLPLQLVSRVVPARYLVVCLRGTLLQGRGFGELWDQLLSLAVLALIIVVLTTRKFRRRLD